MLIDRTWAVGWSRCKIIHPHSMHPQRLSAASYWLPQYDLRRLQSELADASVRLGRAAAPRRRFAFSGLAKAGDTAQKDVPSRVANTPVNGSLPDPSRASEQPNGGPSTLTVSSTFPGEVLCVDADGKDVNITGLEGATVRLEGCPSALYVSSLCSCTIRAGPISGACLVEGRLSIHRFLLSMVTCFHSAPFAHNRVSIVLSRSNKVPIRTGGPSDSDPQQHREQLCPACLQWSNH